MRGVLLTFACVGSAALAGCSRPPAKPVETPAADLAAAAPEAAIPADIPAESGLSIKRGVVMLARDRATFRACGETAELWIIDQSDGSFAQEFAAETRAGPATLYVEAYGERSPLSDEDPPQAQAYAGAFVLEEVLYAGMQGEIGACDKPEPDYIVLARGSEPFWAAEVREDAVVWRQPEPPNEIALGVPEVQNAEGAARYRAAQGSHALELLVHAQSCRDPMSGALFAFAATAVLDGTELNGCARVGR